MISWLFVKLKQHRGLVCIFFMFESNMYIACSIDFIVFRTSMSHWTDFVTTLFLFACWWFLINLSNNTNYCIFKSMFAWHWVLHVVFVALHVQKSLLVTNHSLLHGNICMDKRWVLVYLYLLVLLDIWWK